MSGGATKQTLSLYLEKISRAYKRLNRQTRLVIAAIVFGSIGMFALQASHAATSGAETEAESGGIEGDAISMDGAGASGGKAVTFGAVASGKAVGTPYELLTFTGGDSIALHWREASPITTIKEYDIFRDGSQVATVTPGFHFEYPDRDGNGYIDKNVTKGKTYQYQVQAVSKTGVKSQLSAQHAATHPSNSMAPPTITYELNGNTDLDGYMKNTVVPYLKIWYPKMATLYDYPDVTPRSSYKIILGAIDVPGYTYQDTGEITVNTQPVRETQNSSLGLFLHESTHVLQSKTPGNGGGPGWLTEGVANMGGSYIIFSDIPAIPTVSYTAGYDATTYFLNWIQQKYDSNYIRRLTIKGFKNQMMTSDMKAGGKMIDQLFSEMLGQPLHTGPFTNSSSKLCIDVPDVLMDDYTSSVARVATCNGSDNQKLTADTGPSGSAGLHIFGECLNVDGLSTADGASVVFAKCDDKQQWSISTDNSIIDLHSSKCLTSKTQSSGAGLIIKTCDNSTQQQWGLPANTPRQSDALGRGPITFKSNSSKCIDDPSGNTADGTQLQVWDCNGLDPQVWRMFNNARGNMNISVFGTCMTDEDNVVLLPCNGISRQRWEIQPNGSLKSYATSKCLDTADQKIANTSKIIVALCNGSASQLFNFPTSVSTKMIPYNPAVQTRTSDALRP